MTEDQAAKDLATSSLLELCSKYASGSFEEERIPEIPQELEDMIRVKAAHDLIGDIESWSVVKVYLVHGNVRSDRRGKFSEIAFGYGRPSFLSDETRNGIYLCEENDIPDVDMDQLRDITRADRSFAMEALL
jgi:hypothetical protein